MAAKRKTSAVARPRFAVVADVHVGNHQRFGGPQVNGINTRCRLTIDALDRAIELAFSEGCSQFFVAGDLFHTRRPEPAVIAAVQWIFNRRDRIRIVVVPGNHDMLDADATGKNTACAPLWESAAVIDSAAAWSDDFVLVPYSSRVPMAAHLAEMLAPGAPGVQQRPRTLVTHVGVWDEADAAPWQRRAKDGISATALFDLMERANIRFAFVGNYHEHRMWDRGDMRIVQVGTLCPTGFGDAGLSNRGLVAISDGLTARSLEVPGPRFIIVPAGTAYSIDPEARGRTFVRAIDWDVPADLEAKLGGVERVDTSSFASTIEEGGKEEQSAVDPVVALRCHVERMDLPDGIDRGNVLDLVMDFWKKGA